jgi:hypothetical protein
LGILLEAKTCNSWSIWISWHNKTTLAKKLFDLLDIYGLKNEIITYVKNKCSNLNTLIIVLKSIVKYEVLNLKESFQRTYFEHVFSKAYQYATTNEKVYRAPFQIFFVKCAHVNLHKYIYFFLKSNKGWQEWNKACVKASLRPRKLNTLVKTRLVFFLGIFFSNFFFYARFFDFGVFKLFCWSLMCLCKFANKIILFQETLQFKATFFFAIVNKQ